MNYYKPEYQVGDRVEKISNALGSAASVVSISPELMISRDKVQNSSLSAPSGAYLTWLEINESSGGVQIEERSCIMNYYKPEYQIGDRVIVKPKKLMEQENVLGGFTTIMEDALRGTDRVVVIDGPLDSNYHYMVRFPGHKRYPINSNQILGPAFVWDEEAEFSDDGETWVKDSFRGISPGDGFPYHSAGSYYCYARPIRGKKVGSAASQSSKGAVTEPAGMGMGTGRIRMTSGERYLLTKMGEVNLLMEKIGKVLKSATDKFKDEKT